MLDSWSTKMVGTMEIEDVLGHDPPLTFATFLLVLVTAVLAYVAYRIPKKVDEWNRAKATMEFASRWNDGEIADVREKFRYGFPYEAEARYSLEYLDAKFAGQRGRHLKSRLVLLLNHLDIVALAYETNVIDKKHTEHLYGFVIASFYNNFEHYIQQERQKSGKRLPGPKPEPDFREVWSYLHEVGKKFRNDGIGPLPVDRALKKTKLKRWSRARKRPT